MNKLKKVFTIILFFIIFYLLFKYNYLLSKSVITAVNLWLNKVFPTLFIMFILSDIIINTNILNDLTIIIRKPFNKIFKTNGDAPLAFLLAIISGTPTSAFIINEMLNQKRIDKTTANKLISYTYFSNPLFLYNILKITFNKTITIKIIIIHYITNIIIGVFFNSTKVKELNINNYYNKINTFSIISESIKKSLNTMLMILGIITFYMIITNILINVLPFNNIIIVIIKGLLEITQSLSILNSFNSTSIIKEIIAICIISFGGLSIHTQVYSLIKDSDISYCNFFKGRILHVLISAITYLLIP